MTIIPTLRRIWRRLTRPDPVGRCEDPRCECNARKAAEEAKR